MVCSAVVAATVAITPSTFVPYFNSFSMTPAYVSRSHPFFQQGFHVPPQLPLHNPLAQHFHHVCLPDGGISVLLEVSPSHVVPPTPSLTLLWGSLGFPLC